MNWQDYRKAFESEQGGLKDIYVLNTSVSDWQRLIDSFRAGPYKFSYTHDWEEAALPEQVEEIFRIRNEEASADMRFYIGSVLLACHFFDEEWIEFDIDPRDVKSEADAEGVFDFMRRIGELLNKEVILTDECGADTALHEVLIRYSPSSKQVQYVRRSS